MVTIYMATASSNHNGVVTGPLRAIEISGDLDGGYLIAEADDDRIYTAASDDNLRLHLYSRGLTEREVGRAIDDLKRPLQKVWLWV